MKIKKQVVGNSMVPAVACIVCGYNYVAVACPSFIYSLTFFNLLLLTASVSWSRLVEEIVRVPISSISSVWCNCTIILCY